MEIPLGLITENRKLKLQVWMFEAVGYVGLG